MTRFDPLYAAHDIAHVKHRTIVGAGATAVAQFVKFFLQFGTQILLARMLDPAQFGLVAMVAPVLSLVLTLNDFGLGQAIVQRPDITHSQVSSLFWLNLGVGTGLTLLAMCAAPLIAWIYGEPRTLLITMASASLILTSSFAIVPLGLLNRQMRFVPLAITEVVSMMAGLASGIVSARLGAGYWSLVIMQAVNSFVLVVLAWAYCGWLPGKPAYEPSAGALMRFGANLLGSNFAAYLSASADHVIIGVVNGKVALGLYDRSHNLVVKPLMQLMAPASRVAVPLLSRLHDRPDRYTRAYLMMLQLAMAACVPGLIATILVADPLIGLLFGEKWMGMVPVFAWIGFGGMGAALSASTSWLFVTQNRTAEQMRCNIIVAFISVSAFALGSLGGVVGVAMVSALSYLLLQTPFLVWAATRKGPVSLSVLYGGLLPVILAGCASALAIFGFLYHLAGPRLFIVAMAFVAAYSAFLAALWIQPAGRRFLSDIRSMLVLRAAPA